MAISDPVRSSYTEHLATKKYYLRAGPMWLHWSATKLTDKRKEAWRGTIDQARNCRRDYPAAAGCKAISVNSDVPTKIVEEA